MPAVVTTKTLSAWRARRTSQPDRSLPRRHTEAEQEKGRFRPARLTPATLGTPPLSVRLRGECIAEIEPDFTPLPRIRHPAFICDATRRERQARAASWIFARTDLP